MKRHGTNEMKPNRIPIAKAKAKPMPIPIPHGHVGAAATRYGMPQK